MGAGSTEQSIRRRRTAGSATACRGAADGYNDATEVWKRCRALALDVRELSRHPLRRPAHLTFLAALAGLVGVSAAAAQTRGSLPLRPLARVPLSGAAVRFDYTSIDPKTHTLWISHMDADQLLAFDVVHRKLRRTIPAPGVHGVIAVPQIGRVYASATNAHEVLTIDSHTGK